MESLPLKRSSPWDTDSYRFHGIIGFNGHFPTGGAGLSGCQGCRNCYCDSGARLIYAVFSLVRGAGLPGCQGCRSDPISCLPGKPGSGTLLITSC